MKFSLFRRAIASERPPSPWGQDNLYFWNAHLFFESRQLSLITIIGLDFIRLWPKATIDLSSSLFTSFSIHVTIRLSKSSDLFCSWNKLEPKWWDQDTSRTLFWKLFESALLDFSPSSSITAPSNLWRFLTNDLLRGLRDGGYVCVSGGSNFTNICCP